MSSCFHGRLLVIKAPEPVVEVVDVVVPALPLPAVLSPEGQHAGGVQDVDGVAGRGEPETREILVHRLLTADELCARDLEPTQAHIPVKSCLQTTRLQEHFIAVKKERFRDVQKF